ncbi:hypothetical protein SAMN05444920_102749 [Nonomuraea solani]|uniref:Uncharacterized protein n=1 Tax=Nonomuraea solani TaxID=1144553 RepID=A0A1H5ZLS1_9ACTN|nr:hypothetical protein [Nonomuraea solani]SEG37080.1 hypothetical protein SAMN05444920_102749 [Nonomuraea solani]
MIAVLLASAEPGRERPAVRDTYDVVRGGLSIRLRHAVSHAVSHAAGPGARRHWRDAIEVAALIAPLALFAAALIRAATYGAWAMQGPVVQGEAAQLLELVVYALPYGLMTLLAWLGRSRAAAACAGLYAVLSAWSKVQRERDWSPEYVVTDGVILVMGEPVALGSMVLPLVLCALMLVAAPSPGPAAIGTRRLLGWTAVVLGGSAGSLLISYGWSYLAAIVVAAMALRSPVGRRAVVVLVPMAAVFAGGVPGAGDVANTALLGTLAAAVLGVAAWLARSGGSAPSRPAEL